MKAHKFVSAALLVLCFLHIILIIPVLKGRSLFVILSGSITVVVMLFLIALCHMIKDGKKKMWWHRAFTIWMAACITAHIAAYIIDFNAYQRNIEKAAQVLESFEEIDCTKIADGVYVGEYDAGYIYAKVEVEIRGGELLSIRLLEHRNERGKPAEAIIDDIIAEQKINVDAVSGATNSGNVIKTAVGNALQSRN